MELRVDRVSFAYPGGIRALGDVSLTASRGVFGLLGPNGAGKTTLMRIVATLQEPQTGAVRFGHIDILSRPRALREVLGYLPQEFGLDPRLSAEEFLDHLALLRGILDAKARRAHVGEALERTHLAALRRRRLGSFSGGMKQRLGVAQALLARPQLLVIDEPTAGLDPEERAHLLEVLSEVGREAVVILSTHIVEDVAATCSRLAVLSEGAVLYCGDPDAAVATLAGQVWETEHDAGTLRALTLRTRLHSGLRSTRLFAADRPGEGCRAVAPSLEDFYFACLRRSQKAA